MKLNKLATVIALASGMATFAVSADQGSGQIDFTGSIIDAPCSIHPDSVNQEIDLGKIAAKHLLNSGTSNPRPFKILLENCDISGPEKTVTITFGGNNAGGDNKLLGITGTASGAGVAMTDGSGNRIELGVATDARTLTTGNNTLAFSAFLQGLNNVTPVTGDFYASTDFTLAYQ
ncbi:type 1 fimbria pilin [Serratia fonticola]|jgi:type 1 fimbria pilin|uniref:Type 1 fimbria pilin n=1 Tax=Serratia fonticola TaxID=47917 RepID=A0A542D722_SERFO|nr:fimbrial protein [Serratia fonticola]TQI79096.1 type 1 fimbria pilin [Serratia fonticola]TQI98881.1 type 1 fimbria pilin [Serratia fonticola]TVZ68406.1 type 1 fimbria pilin [Serratia fonticola]